MAVSHIGEPLVCIFHVNMGIYLKMGEGHNLPIRELKCVLKKVLKNKICILFHLEVFIKAFTSASCVHLL